MKFQFDFQLFVGEKMEKVILKKRQDMCKKGQVVKSMEIFGVFIFLFIFLIMMVFSDFYKECIVWLFIDIFMNWLSLEIIGENVMVFMMCYGIEVMLLLVFVLIGVVVVVLIVNYMQVGFLFVGEGLKLKFEKFDLIKGFKNIFLFCLLVEFVKFILKMLIIGYLVYSMIISY